MRREKQRLIKTTIQELYNEKLELTPEQIAQADKCVRALKETVVEDIVNGVIESEFFQEILESKKKQSSSRNALIGRIS